MKILELLAALLTAVSAEQTAIPSDAVPANGADTAPAAYFSEFMECIVCRRDVVVIPLESGFVSYICENDRLELTDDSDNVLRFHPVSAGKDTITVMYSADGNVRIVSYIYIIGNDLTAELVDIRESSPAPIVPIDDVSTY